MQNSSTGMAVSSGDGVNPSRPARCRSVDDTMRPGLQEWSEHGGLGMPPAALTAALWYYAVLHGAIALELNGHLPPALLRNETLFVTALTAVVSQFVS